MAQAFTHDYVLSFESDYDISVVSNSTSPDKDSPSLQSVIQNNVSSMKSIMQFQPGIKRMTTYDSFNNLTYQINLTLP